MTEYKLEVKDSSKPESRLEFFNRLEAFLNELRDDGIIQSYRLSTPYGSITIFKREDDS